jgi:hypothetical protein
MARKDIYKVDIQPNLYFLVFHKTLPKGSGPAVSLYINNYEFLKFDCFGEKKGHYHIYDAGNEEIYFSEKTCDEQIQKICELLTNINFILQKSNKRDIKNIIIDMNTFIPKINEVKIKMLEYENKFYSALR